MKINEALNPGSFSSISLFDDGNVSGIKPTGTLRGELRENKIKEILLSSYHNTNSHQAVLVEQFDVTQDPRMPTLANDGAQLIRRKQSKKITYLTCQIQEILKTVLAKKKHN